MERVKKGEKYWYIHIGDFNPCSMWDWEDDSMYANGRYDNHNYFHTEEEAEAIVRKIEAVLKGADVIEMPSEGDVINAARERSERHSIAEAELHKGLGKLYGYSRIENAETVSFEAGVEWLKSKIIK